MSSLALYYDEVSSRLYSPGMARKAREERRRVASADDSTAEDSTYVLPKEDIREFLLLRGYSDEDIDKMSAQEANRILDDSPYPDLSVEESPVKKETKKKIVDTTKLNDWEANSINAKIDALKKKQESAKAEIDALNADIDKANDITVEEYNKGGENKRRNHEAKMDALHSGVEALQLYYDSLSDEVVSLQQVYDALGENESLSSSPSSEWFSDIDFEEGEEDYDTFSDDVLDIAISKSDLLRRIGKWRNEAGDLTTKIGKLYSKRAVLLRNLTSALSSSYGTPSRSIQNLINDIDGEIEPLLVHQRVILRKRIGLEKELALLSLQEKALTLDWMQESKIPEDFWEDSKSKYDTDEEDAKDIKNEMERRQDRSHSGVPSENEKFFLKSSKSLDTFVFKMLSPNVPSDGKVDKKIASVLNKAHELSDRISELSSKFNNSPAHRSSIRLVAALYSTLLQSMLHGIGASEARAASYQREVLELHYDLISNGMTKEAATLEEAFSFLKRNTKKIVRKAEDLVDRVNAELEGPDLGPRRDPKEKSRSLQILHQQLLSSLAYLERHHEHLGKALQLYSDRNDKLSVELIQTEMSDAITQRAALIKQIDRIEKSDEFSYAHGYGKGTSLSKQASFLISGISEALIPMLKEGIPDSPSLESDLLRLSTRIVKGVSALPQYSGQRKIISDYPSLHKALIAYHLLFVRLDSAIRQALRSS